MEISAKLVKELRDRTGAGMMECKKALAEAVRLKEHAGRAAKLYIEAAWVEAKAKDDDSKAAVPIYRRLVKKFPHDPQARIYLAESLCDGYDDAGEPKPGQKECIAILEGVLKDAPNDSAANHYWIHAIEPGNHPERALTSAALLASLAPTSGHMVHMPGHIYYRVGNYREAEKWFSASTKADEKYMREQHVGPDDDWNYAHNMMYAIANLMEQGRLNDANGLSDHLAGARGKLSNSLYIWSARDQVARVSYRLPVALRVGDWDAVLTMLGQVNLEGDKTVNLRALTAELTDYATGMKALETNDVAAAQAASDRMDAGLWRVQQRQKEEAAAKAKAREEEKKKPEAKKDEPPMMPVMPDALSERAMYLGFGQVMIEHSPAIVHRYVFEYAHLASFAIYLDHGYVSAGSIRGTLWGEIAPGCQPFDRRAIGRIGWFSFNQSRLLLDQPG